MIHTQKKKFSHANLRYKKDVKVILTVTVCELR
jgi:hypothetical protein